MADNEDDKFLSRWSRLKRDAKVAPSSPAVGGEVPGASVPLQAQDEPVSEDSPLPRLPPVDELTMDSDFRGFLHPEVAQNVRHAALKKLFSDPHFNVMDGLDTYIDDYSIPDPLPMEMLAQMRSAQKIFKWARDDLEDGETAATPTPAPDVAQAAVAPDVLSKQPIEPPLAGTHAAPPIALNEPVAEAARPPDPSEGLRLVSRDDT